MSDSEDAVDLVNQGEDALFGDEEDDVANSVQGNVLSDKDLESVQEEDNDVGAEYGAEDAEDGHQHRVIMGLQVYRHRTPKTKDGTIQSLRVPKFLKFVPEQYDPKTFEPSKWDVENAKEDKPIPTIRFYTDPDTGELKSNALMYKWSDGSMSMSVGDQHYAIQKKETAPPRDKPYHELQDGHSYAAAAHLSSSLFVTVGHISEEYTVRINKTLEDDALQRLAMRMREATKSSQEGNRIIKTTHDPELQKKQAELAEKERLKAQRRRENAAARTDGGARYGRGALSIDDLEGPRRAPGGGRKRGAAGSGRAKRRRPEYDSDDDMPQGARRQEDYDLEDDFIAPSDEDVEEEDGEEEEEEEELLDDEDEEAAPRSKRPKTAEAEDDKDAEGDLDDDAQLPQAADHSGRARRRKVIEDDEE